MLGYIYLVTNKINNKKYVGLHKSDKFEHHYKGSGTLIKKALKKYGKENFSVEILHECFSLEELAEKEQQEISIRNAVENDEYYNLQGGGYTIWEETHQKQSMAKKGKVWDREVVERRNKSLRETYKKNGSKLKDRPVPEERKKKISESHKKRWKTQTHHAKGSTQTEEANQKRRETQSGIWNGGGVKKGYKHAIVVCPHCGKEGGKPVMGRHHFDNCKQK